MYIVGDKMLPTMFIGNIDTLKIPSTWIDTGAYMNNT